MALILILLFFLSHIYAMDRAKPSSQPNNPSVPCKSPEILGQELNIAIYTMNTRKADDILNGKCPVDVHQVTHENISGQRRFQRILEQSNEPDIAVTGTAMDYAIRNNLISYMFRLRRLGVDISGDSPISKRALKEVAAKCNRIMFDTLVEQFEAVPEPDILVISSYTACQHIFEYLMKRQARNLEFLNKPVIFQPPNSPHESRMNALIAVCSSPIEFGRFSRNQMVYTLIKAGVDVNIEGKINDCTEGPAIYFAARNNQRSIVDMLFAAGAKIYNRGVTHDCRPSYLLDAVPLDMKITLLSNMEVSSILEYYALISMYQSIEGTWRTTKQIYTNQKILRQLVPKFWAKSSELKLILNQENSKEQDYNILKSTAETLEKQFFSILASKFEGQLVCRNARVFRAETIRNSNDIGRIHLSDLQQEKLIAIMAHVYADDSKHLFSSNPSISPEIYETYRTRIDEVYLRIVGLPSSLKSANPAIQQEYATLLRSQVRMQMTKDGIKSLTIDEERQVAELFGQLLANNQCLLSSNSPFDGPSLAYHLKILNDQSSSYPWLYESQPINEKVLKALWAFRKFWNRIIFPQNGDTLSITLKPLSPADSRTIQRVPASIKFDDLEDFFGKLESGENNDDVGSTSSSSSSDLAIPNDVNESETRPVDSQPKFGIDSLKSPTPPSSLSSKGENPNKNSELKNIFRHRKLKHPRISSPSPPSSSSLDSAETTSSEDQLLVSMMQSFMNQQQLALNKNSNNPGGNEQEN